ncbi:hypothetical protein NLI96_g6110 [Meripilus lineatus]|uniref:Uncharacterized protein n=1 Tax=Meripilus lineatus TaxID=2056292 RepID=A0AAD5V3J6_9APHY|nr:hypothetical protein NLI96_g6110 [Physisporinus lineatus]
MAKVELRAGNDDPDADPRGRHMGSHGGLRGTLWPESEYPTEQIFPTRIIHVPAHFGGLGYPSPIPPNPPSSWGPNHIIHFPDALEANRYYWGLPSVPLLLARSAINSTWEQPCGFEAYSQTKEFRSMPKHALHDVWEANLAFKIHDVLDSHDVQWTSTDIACFGWKDDGLWRGQNKSPSFLVLWIGVMEPDHFDEMNADRKAEYVRGVAQVIPECLKLLQQYGIDDVDVEIRHSAVTLCGQLQAPIPSDPVPDERHPFTTAIGHTICPKDNIKSHGTGGFFVTTKGDPNRLLLVTARHVVFPGGDNRHFENIDASQPRHDVVLFGSDSDFEAHLSEVEGQRRQQQSLYDSLVSGEGHLKYLWTVDATKFRLSHLDSVLRELNDHWNSVGDRRLGHVILAPPNNSFPHDRGHYDGNQKFDSQEHDPIAEDWAVIEVDSSKINASNFKGNVLDLGKKLSFFQQNNRQLYQLATAMKEDDPTSPMAFSGLKHLLELSGCVSDDSYSKPMQVLKRGHTSKLTVGRSNGIPSYFRMKHDNTWSTRLKAWPIYSFLPGRIFAQAGDSGSAVVDRTGRIFGLLFAGASSCAPGTAMDVSFVMPVKFLRERMEQYGLHDINFEPILTQ